MKLLVELQDHQFVSMLTEGEGEAKQHYIKGLFLEFDSPNRNNRIYRSEHHDESVKKYITEKVENRNAWGELDHPDGPVVSLKNASHRIVEMWKDGSNWYGKAVIVPNDIGNIVKGLLECGGNLGVSSRGMGTLKPVSEGSVMEVQPGYKILTAGDIVSDPSAHGAFVQGLMENVEYFFDEKNGVWLPERTTAIRNKLKKMTVKEIEEKKLTIFSNFLTELQKSI
jgi:hypothetical protein